jgi:hypothetical protein
VLFRVLVLGAVVATAAPAAAQQATETPDPAKSQILMFEMGLRKAVESGGQRLAQRALQLVPGVVLAPGDEPVVRGVPIPEYGFYFDVQIPDILQSGLQLFEMVRGTSAGNAGPVRASAGDQRVEATGSLVTADPMAPNAAFDPDREYTEYVREALIDAMLDNSGLLPLTDNDWLMLSASGFDRPIGNPLYRMDSRKLILRIKGADLLLLRQGKISRDEAKHRIIEKRF